MKTVKLYKGNKLLREGKDFFRFNDHCRDTWMGSDKRVDCDLRVIGHISDERSKVSLAVPYGDCSGVKNPTKGCRMGTYVEIIDIENADISIINYLLSRDSELKDTGIYINRFLVRILDEKRNEIFPQIGEIVNSKNVIYYQSEERTYVHSNGYPNL